jgi:hypothetical protein
MIRENWSVEKAEPHCPQLMVPAMTGENCMTEN